METGLPRALGPHRQPPNDLRAPPLRLCFQVLLPPCPLWVSLLPPFPLTPHSLLLLLLFHSSPLLLPPALFSYLPPPFTPFPPPPSSLFTSLPPSSLCPGVQVRRGSVRRFLCSRRSRPHLERGFLQLLSVTHYRNPETGTLLSVYKHAATVHDENIWLFLATSCDWALLNLDV